jgi:hypothetical protein
MACLKFKFCLFFKNKSWNGKGIMVFEKKNQITKVIPNPLNGNLRSEIIFNLGTWYIIGKFVWRVTSFPLGEITLRCTKNDYYKVPFENFYDVLLNIKKLNP